MLGESVGPYRILEQLGKGGMGIVYRAHDERLDRDVALKFLPPQLSSDERAKQRFIQEARAASALDHANICTVHDIGETGDGQVYIVMAFYDGATLKYRLEDGALADQEAVSVALQVARGLASAHAAGIVHRDVKPANVMVTDRGEVRILDFGVAKLASSLDLTQEGSTIGTAAYMSPEQSRGEAVDHRADQWSLGVILYEMLTGRRPFGGGYDAAMVYAILNEDPADLASLRPDTDPGLVMLVERLLSKNPDDRFATTDELVDALRLASGDSTVVTADRTAARPAAGPHRTTLSTGRIVGLYGAIAVVALAAVYFATRFFGLPDWVVTLAVLLIAIGLPILILAGAVERQRSVMDTSERSALTGISAWLTLRRASVGGVLAMALLAVFSGGYMTLRALGIGPAGTLVAQGALAERDLVVLADFENRTSDPNLGISITEAFRIDLSQSSIVTLVDAGTVRDALERMQRDPDMVLDEPAAREVAERVGAKAVLAGDIASIGSSYQLVGRLVSATDGMDLVGIRENAADDGAILAAIDRLSGRLRERIGESLVTIRAGEPLENVSTTSMPALRLYSEADAAADRGDFENSEELLREAIDIDSTFAMAWRKLAVVLNNTSSDPAERADASRTAHALRDRLPERERLLAEAAYFNWVIPDEDRRVSIYESVLERWPDDLTALNNLGMDYNERNRPGDAETLLRRAVEISEGITFRTNLIDALALQDKWEEAESELLDFVAHYPDQSHPWMWRARIAAKRSDFDLAYALLDSADLRVQGFSDSFAIATVRTTIAELRGRFDEATDLIVETSRQLVERGFEGAWYRTVRIAIDKALLTGDLAPVRRLVDDLVVDHSLSEIAPTGRPDPFVAMTYAFLDDVERAQSVLDRWEAEVPPELRPNRPFVTLAVLAQRRGDNELALGLLDSLRAARNCPECEWATQGYLYLWMDSLRAAASSFERFLADSSGFGITEEEAPVRYRLGGLYDALGEPDRAIRNYARFVDLWQDADPDLQPFVSRARDEIGRLLELQTREPAAVPAPGGP